MSKEPYPSETADRYIVRFPDGMRDRLKKLAADNGRSLNSQIIHMLEFAFDEMAISATTYGDKDPSKDNAEFLRKEIAKNSAILEQILATITEKAEEPAPKPMGGGTSLSGGRMERPTRLNAPIKPFKGGVP